jgi:tripartite-type tricarboxylate transporter receptor subunit TctC
MTLARRSVLTGLAAVSLSTQVRSQQPWPSQIIRLVVPFTPGGSTDVLARLIASRLEQTIPGKGFVIENRPGAAV